jgi:formamidopyrimidine-DNA glycosylase
VPELPEVETTRRGIEPWLAGRRIRQLLVRERQLRWPVPAGIEQRLRGAEVREIGRRGKYLLLNTDAGTALIHLGMSGRLHVLPCPEPPDTHDHFDIVADSGTRIRFHDPRRFGSLLWAGSDPARHPLLAALGPEPLGPDFDGGYLWQRSRRRRVSIKQHLMNPVVVVGVGNIYASEALFRAGIDPRRPAGRISRSDMDRLASAARELLTEAIRQGGTTLRDFAWGDGQPGYFAQELRVYGRKGEDCLVCGTPIRQIVQGQRSTFFCPRCQR